MPPASGPSSPRPTCPATPHYPERIFYYFSVHLRLHVRPSFVVDITPHIDAKMKAIACYHSQFIEGRPTAPPTLLDDLRDRRALLGLGDRCRVMASRSYAARKSGCAACATWRDISAGGIPHLLHLCGFCGSAASVRVSGAVLRAKPTLPASR